LLINTFFPSAGQSKGNIHILNVYGSVIFKVSFRLLGNVAFKVIGDEVVVNSQKDCKTRVLFAKACFIIYDLSQTQSF